MEFLRAELDFLNLKELSMKIFGKIAFSVLSLTFLSSTGTVFNPPLPPDEGEGEPTPQIFTSYEENMNIKDWECEG